MGCDSQFDEPKGQMQAQRPLSKEATIYEMHQHAVQEWVDACHEFLMANKKRTAAESKLRTLNEQMMQYMQLSTNDPTEVAVGAMQAGILEYRPEGPNQIVRPGNGPYQIGGSLNPWSKGPS